MQAGGAEAEGDADCRNRGASRSFGHHKNLCPLGRAATQMTAPSCRCAQALLLLIGGSGGGLFRFAGGIQQPAMGWSRLQKLIRSGRLQAGRRGPACAQQRGC